jgi:hypothetical protein
MNSPSHYSTNFKLVESRIKAPAYKNRVKEGSDVACFLKVADRATQNISPVSYNPLDSFNKTQTKNYNFKLGARRRDYIDVAIKKSK